MEEKYYCNCRVRCMKGGREEPKEVSKSTWNAHAPLRAQITPYATFVEQYAQYAQGTTGSQVPGPSSSPAARSRRPTTAPSSPPPKRHRTDGGIPRLHDREIQIDDDEDEEDERDIEGEEMNNNENEGAGGNTRHPDVMYGNDGDDELHQEWGEDLVQGDEDAREGRQDGDGQGHNEHDGDRAREESVRIIFISVHRREIKSFEQDDEQDIDPGSLTDLTRRGPSPEPLQEGEGVSGDHELAQDIAEIDQGDFEVEATLEELKTAQEFIAGIRGATLAADKLPASVIQRLRTAKEGKLNLDDEPELLTAIELFLDTTSASEDVFNNV
ncbi:hypothetical protein NLJ89_g5714 [Agrocybe chaxingu]|uniref:Uncharacterized protein n=1 Tax=Agrocybe chaxingu TaxID=84603 RepID=A0A9W8MWP3_9AGAR|nr:hypothetical protein NLJ89_g5714 [Agrocybe chaxingu]